MKKIIFKGCATAIITPFDEDNNINYNEFKKIIEFQIENGINAIVVCGTTGETATLSRDEKKELIRYCVEVVDKRVPVIAGVGSNNTKEVLKNIKDAEEADVDGLLVVTPYYNKTTQKGIIEHYTIIANATKLPIILYNVPGRTGVDIKPETYKELSKIKNIVATKEASGDISKILKIKYLCGDNLEIYSGNDDQVIPILSLGGIGVISVLSNIKPRFTSDMVDKYFKNKIQIAKNMQINSCGLIENLFKEVNPIPVKETMKLIGFDCGSVRLPLVRCSKTLLKEIEKEIKNI